MTILKKCITYAGIENPKSLQEIDVEMCGLENVIYIAKELISRYEQIISIMKLEASQDVLQNKSATEDKKG